MANKTVTDMYTSVVTSNFTRFKTFFFFQFLTASGAYKSLL